MNIENARALIAFMQDKEAQKGLVFDMNTWAEEATKKDPLTQERWNCGTACCLAGEETIRLVGIEAARDLANSAWHFEKKAAQSLGLTPEEAELLFIPDVKWVEAETYRLDNDEESPWFGVCDDPYNATLAQGIQAIENAIRMWGVPTA